MEQQEITQNNELITKFMGLHNKSGLTHPFAGQNMDIEDARYHESWDWLMPVIESIIERETFIEFDIKRNGTYIRVFNIDNETLFECYPKINTKEATSLSVTYNAVLRYIEFYNNK